MGRSQSNNYTDTYEVQTSMTKVLGSHTLKAGFDIRQINYELQNTGDILSFSGNTNWTQRVYNVSEQTSGDGYASFLLGIVGGSSNYPLFPWWKQIYAAPYIQDDWKVSRKLTLNLGLRWDFNAPLTRSGTGMNGPFDPNVANPAATRDRRQRGGSAGGGFDSLLPGLAVCRAGEHEGRHYVRGRERNWQLAVPAVQEGDRSARRLRLPVEGELRHPRRFWAVLLQPDQRLSNRPTASAPAPAWSTPTTATARRSRTSFPTPIRTGF